MSRSSAQISANIGLMLEPLPANKPRKPGSLKDKIKIADDFDEPLPEFKPYTE